MTASAAWAPLNTAEIVARWPEILFACATLALFTFAMLPRRPR
ncbi:hypothetical protein [Rhodopseudomonas sp. AAP120]|nr:hypothetical protein [Rhodopseudomonas sp. AAP120]